MEQGRHVHFFCPKKRINIGVQTTNSNFFLKKNKDTDSNLYDLIHDSCVNSILTQSYFHPNSRVKIHFINEVRSKVGFIVSNLKNDRFDTLSLPDDTEDNRYNPSQSNRFSNTLDNCFYSPDLYFEFRENHFYISNLKSNTSCKYTYNSNSYNLFNSLETSSITDYFLSSVDSIISDNI